MTDIEAPVETADMDTAAAHHEPGSSPENPASSPLHARTPLAAAALLAACGGGGGGNDGGNTPEAPAVVGIVDFPTSGFTHADATSDAEAARFLQQAQFSSTPTEITELRGMSYAQWLANQFANYRGITGWN